MLILNLNIMLVRKLMFFIEYFHFEFLKNINGGMGQFLSIKFVVCFVVNVHNLTIHSSHLKLNKTVQS